MRPIDADALIEFCEERWIPLNIDAVNMQPTIQPEKAQLSQEGTTKDTISRTETVEHLRRVLDVTVPITDYDSGYVDGVEFGVSTVSTMPTIQPVATDTNVGNNSEIPNSSDAVSRQAVIDALDVLCQEHRYRIPGRRETYSEYNEAWQDALDRAEGLIFNLPPAQPEPQWIPVERELPETEEFVLASLTGKYRNTTFEHACEIADYADGEWCVYAYPHMSAEKCEELIEAWMPLPEAYKPNK